jgi:hypothetical protein
VLAEYSYNDLGRRTRRDYLNATWTAYSYDEAGRLAELVNWRTGTEVISSFAYAHDNVGNRTSMTMKAMRVSRGYQGCIDNDVL